MFTNAGREKIYAAYRTKLKAFLDIPTDASDRDIQELIEVGFFAETVQSFCDIARLSSSERDQIINLKTLKTRLAHGQRLTAHESYRLYSFVHINALADALFGSNEKAKRWLAQPKSRFSGQTPMSMLTTTLGTQQVEEMLIQLAEGFSF